MGWLSCLEARTGTKDFLRRPATGCGTILGIPEQYGIAQTGEPYWKGMFNKHGIQTAIVQLTEPSGQMNPLMKSLRMDKEWAMVFAKDNAAVFIRKDGV